MLDLTKTQKRLARALVSTVYERELNSHLEILAKKFEAWRENKITGWELNEFIHQHHDGISRELYTLYNSKMHSICLLERAIKMGFLKMDEVPSELIS